MFIFGILGLALLIVVHELGHFLVAKWFNVGVIEFAVGFGKQVASYVKGETRYSLRIVPLGGYVRMTGDNPAALETEELADLSKGAAGETLLAPEDELTDLQKSMVADKSRWFLKQGLFAKAAIVIAGPLFNLLFAIFLAFVSYLIFGVPDISDADTPLKAIVGNVVPDSPAEKAGIKRLDLVKFVNGHAVNNFKELREAIISSDGQEISMTIERKIAEKPENIEIKVKPIFDTKEIDLMVGQDHKPSPSIGINAFIERRSATLKEALIAAPIHVYEITRLSLRSLYLLATNKISSKNVGGPLTILDETSRAAENGGEHFVNILIFLSTSLAVFNLLPIPVLDGGHLLFFLIEALKGSPVSLKAQNIATQVGLFLLLSLMIFATSNDIPKLLRRWGVISANS